MWLSICGPDLMGDAEETPADRRLATRPRADHVALVYIAARLFLGNVHLLFARYYRDYAIRVKSLIRIFVIQIRFL